MDHQQVKASAENFYYKDIFISDPHTTMHE